MSHHADGGAAPVGFSWTTLFFGFFPAIVRGHAKGAIVQFLVAVVTLGLSGFVFPFVYNKWYLKTLLAKGYAVKSSSRPIDEIEGRSKVELPKPVTA